MSATSPAVFISYASQDAEAAGRICDALRAAGVDVWFDRSELRGGDAWDQKIRREIRECALFLPVISVHTAARAEGYFRLEWSLAEQRSHMIARNKAFIVPVCLDHTPESGADVPEPFQRVQWTQLLDGDTPPAFTARIVALLGAHGSVAASDDPTQSGTAIALVAPSTLESSGTAKSASSQSRLVIALVAAIGLGLAYFAADRLWLSTRTLNEQLATSAPAAAAAAAPAMPDKSVAVLPFVDMSEKKDQEYFSDGLSEELIDMLTKVSNLRVPARTSSFYFKGKQTTIADIAKALGVTHVLEGSVRKSGKTLRITAQLIQADNGYHVWSETYDRQMHDIFKIQDEIGRAVVTALKAAMSGSAGLPIATTENSDAFTLYLKARYLQRHVASPDDTYKAEGYLRKAVAKDATFALAWALLASVLVEETMIEEKHNDARAAEIRRAADKALALGPQLADVQWMIGFIERNDWNWEAAALAFKRAYDADPLDPEKCYFLASELSLQGHNDAAVVDLVEKAVALDPLNADYYDGLAALYQRSGRHAEAERAARKAIDLSPTAWGVHEVLGDILLEQGKPIEALAAYQSEASAAKRHRGAAVAYLSLGRKTEADEALKALEQNNGETFAYSIAVIHSRRGEIDQAFAWLERAYKLHDSSLPGVRRDSWLKSLHGDPRWNPFLHKMNLAE